MMLKQQQLMPNSMQRNTSNSKDRLLLKLFGLQVNEFKSDWL
jgi:hypothetical protein